MKNSPLAAILAGLALGSVPTHAQGPYHAEVAWEIGAGSGYVSGGTASSAVLASINGECHGMPSDAVPCGNSSFIERAGATSAQHALSGYGMGAATPAITASGQGRPRYVFDDVLFTDTASPGVETPISVALNFTYQGEQFGTAPHGVLRIHVRFDDGNGSTGIWESAPLKPSGYTPHGIMSDPISLLTERVYELDITAVFQGSGNQGSSYYIDGSVVWDSTPFQLSAGIDATSAQAGIAGNVRTFATPAISPNVTSDWPLVAGASENLYFRNGQPGSFGAYVVGGLPTGTSIQIGTWAMLDLFPVPLELVPFTADVTGSHDLNFTTPPGLSGVSLGLQAFQLYLGPPAEWYSTNTWELTFQ